MRLLNKNELNKLDVMNYLVLSDDDRYYLYDGIASLTRFANKHQISLVELCEVMIDKGQLELNGISITMI